MIDHQEHFGRRFYKDQKTGYWISTNYPRIRAHRWVWMSCHGKIPKGYHIHHKDEDKSNNDISNLELLEKSKHLSLHMSEQKRSRAKEMADKYRHLTKAWHASAEGHAWHVLHGLKTFAKRPYLDFKCDQCGKEFKSKSNGRTKFCSNNCKSAWRRSSGLDNIEKICKRCGCLFKSNRYSGNECCSIGCAGKQRWIDRKQKSSS